MGGKKELISYLTNLSLILLGILFIAFPLILTTKTTDAFFLPKQLTLGLVVLSTLLIFGTKTLVEGSLRIRRTAFDFPVILLTLSILISALFSINRVDSLLAFSTFLFAALAFFAITNTAKDKSSLSYLIYALIFGATLASVIHILSFLKIYILPFDFTHVKTFTTLGSLFDQALYLALVLPLSGYFAIKIISPEKLVNVKTILSSIASVIIIISLIITVYGLFTPPPEGQKAFILPFETGFQTGFAAISQDTGRVLKGFLFGSGFGTYATDFLRFKQAAFNQNQTLWSLTFLRSSSFVLELLATAGVLGLLSFVFLTLKILKERPFFLPIILALIIGFALPFSFTIQALFFVLLGIFAVVQSLRPKGESRYFDLELHLVALKKGLISAAAFEPSPKSHRQNKIMSIIFFIIVMLIAGSLGFMGSRYLISDIAFQDSSIAASKNDGRLAYQKQADAMTIFPYRDIYHVQFSRINLALANSIASQQPKETTIDAQTQQTISTLIQQSINSARRATEISPLTSVNWQNLSSIYRSLIGFGQNAEGFAIATQQQAIRLNPNSPQEYISLGGIYYQLGNFDNAQNQFQIAVNLKPDFANARYNLGHALESKGDLENALIQYQIVKNLVANDENSLKKINSEIETLQKRIEENPQARKTGETEPRSSSLNLNTPQTQLPAQNPPVKIPAPDASTDSADDQ